MGTVEVYYNSIWGTVCDNEWDLNDAQVVCREIGFGPAITASDAAFYGEGSGQIWLDDLNCDGTELSIANCSHNGWGIHNCDHGEDAGVKCAVSNGNCNYLAIQFIVLLLYLCIYNYCRIKQMLNLKGQ